jgi:hypothetical protein
MDQNPVAWSRGRETCQLQDQTKHGILQGGKNMAQVYTGGCACGAIRYEFAGEPAMAGHCQCRDCQKKTGTGHASLMVFRWAEPKVAGQPKVFEHIADSGATVSDSFCPNCGTPVFRGYASNPNMLSIYVGSLDDPSRFSPQFVIYASRAHAWDYLDPKLPRFPTQPSGG